MMECRKMDGFGMMACLPACFRESFPSIWMRTAVLFLALVLAGCVEYIPPPDPSPTPTPEIREREVRVLPLQGVLTQPDAEISGLAWYGDILVLLPQYPHKWEHSLYGLRREAIAAVLDGSSSEPLAPFPIPLTHSPALRDLEGYEGLEAVVFAGDSVFLSVEARMRDHMQGYLLKGRVVGELDEIVLDWDKVVVMPPQSNLMNKAYESLMLVGDRIVVLYEANGEQVNLNRSALRFDQDLNPLPALDMPAMEFRVTDATAISAQGRFWVLNFHWPGDKKLWSDTDPIRETWGEGPSHRDTQIVERIVEMEMDEEGIRIVDAPPLELELLDKVVSRNWEGIVQWDDSGFLVVTDEFPTTQFAFIPR